jgi:hypothetical protein
MVREVLRIARIFGLLDLMRPVEGACGLARPNLTQTEPIGILFGQYPSHRAAPERAARPVRKTKVTASFAGSVNKTNRLHRVACGEQALLFVRRPPQHFSRMEKSHIQKISKPISEVTTH